MLPKLILEKKADLQKNRIIIPKRFIDKFGRDFKMEIYEDYIKIIPQTIDTKATKLYNEE